MFLDDGIGGSNEYEKAVSASAFTKQSLLDFGFLLADEKCQWDPVQRIEWLGHVLDMKSNHLYITSDRIRRLEKAISSALFQIQITQDNIVPVRFLASITGQIISLQSVLGNKVRLLTRHLFNCINSRASWNAPVVVTDNALSELRFWAKNAEILNKNGRSFKYDNIYLFNVFADASGSGYGGYVENVEALHDICKKNNKIYVDCSEPPEVGNDTMADFHSEHLDTRYDIVTSKILFSKRSISPEVDSSLCLPLEVGNVPNREGNLTFRTAQNCSKHNNDAVFSSIGSDYQVIGSWSDIEKQRSSTWREAEAIHRVMKTYGSVLKNSHVKVYSDNKNVKSILLNGSRKSHVHNIALDLNSFCEEKNIVVCPEWIPREENEKSDYLSRCFDSDDWKIRIQYFKNIDKRWGTHSIDRFASHFNNQCLRFNSRWWVPRTEAVDALSQYWGNDINWLVPPPRLVPDCIKKMQSEQAKCTLIIPKWESAPFWPMLIEADGKFKKFIKEIENLGRFCVTSGDGNNGCFGKDYLSFDMLALRCLP
ncbi:uncharacterized protein LOC132732127 [Ruditapes philippinarum]|uniref:uncharacterized protein LOC132732127 n=1 Tax=Ruditapes philippinarum TaxID=129788 RepID=UPI00295ABD24|nr:uncharacterized protein LOC132732127 [Ruditapes philippinarum]